MIVSISFEELSKIAKEKTKFNFFFQKEDERTIKIEFKLMSLAPSVGIDIGFIKLEHEDLFLSYEGGIASVALDKISNMIPSINLKGIIDLEAHQAIVHLSKIEKAHKVLENVEVNDIKVDENCVNIIFNLKSSDAERVE